MSAPIPAVARRRAGSAAFVTAALAGTLLAPGVAPRADAATVAAAALHVAAAQRGAPYQWGGVGPRRFDCSGLTLYAFRAAGRHLPRTAAAQYARSRHITAGARSPGDLVFFHSGHAVYHVGVYAGGNRIWHAPHTGARVRLERIWTRNVWYGRVT